MWQACYNQEIEKLRFLLSQPKAQKLHKLETAGPDYECLYAKIGSNCMANDGGVWSKSRLLEPTDGSVKLPIHDKLIESDQVILYVFPGDDVFTLKLYMIKTYTQQNLALNKIVCNYDHNRA